MKEEYRRNQPTLLASQSWRQPATSGFGLNLLTQGGTFLGVTLENPLATRSLTPEQKTALEEPLQRAKEVEQLTERNLRADNLFSLVAFDSGAGTVIPLQRARNRQD